MSIACKFRIQYLLILSYKLTSILFRTPCLYECLLSTRILVLGDQSQEKLGFEEPKNSMMKLSNSCINHPFAILPVGLALWKPSHSINSLEIKTFSVFINCSQKNIHQLWRTLAIATMLTTWTITFM